jgi:putative Mn2+ efflux pump MntP
MDFLSLLLLSIGLSFDTFAVSISCGLKEKDMNFVGASRIAIIFGIFQALMPVLGWLIGSSVKNYIASFDHWLAFGLLGLIGIKMIVDNLRSRDEERSINFISFKVIVSLAFATTIDAFIVGITFAFLNINLPLAIVTIGIVTYIFAMVGMIFGQKMGKHFGQRIEIVGGLILIGIGLKILLEHLIK